MTIVGFLMQRIAEDEAVARAATQGDWYWEPPSEESFPMYDESLVSTVLDDDGDHTVVLVGVGYDTSRIEGRDEDRAHIARYHPARVLAECAAKRRIVELHQPDDDKCSVCSHEIGYASDGYGGEYYENQRTGNDWPCATLRALTAVYSDHPDYRQDWAR